jgi:flagellar biosynthesis protein FliQ
VTDNMIITLGLQAMMMAGKLCAPILITALVIGFAISLFQSVTQIQEATLSFVPKAIGVAIALLMSGNWMLHEMIAFTTGLFDQIPTLLGSS